MARVAECLFVSLIFLIIVVSFIKIEFQDYKTLIGAVICISIVFAWVLEYVFSFLWLFLFYKLVLFIKIGLYYCQVYLYCLLAMWN